MGKKALSLRIPDVVLGRRLGVSLVRQLYSALRKQITKGGFLPGERLPSTRSLSKHLGVSRNTVLETYERLAAEGYVNGRVGSGTRVRRALPYTYLSELPRLVSIRAKDFRQSVRQSLFPADHVALLDADANKMYLFTSD